MDKQGRISIPPELREYAGLTKDLVFNVLAKRMEIWDAERWRAYVGQYVEQYSQLHEGVR
jgi:MraZ protein